ncbi:MULTISPECIES: hypothetical protein [unclassified Erwinia]|uniref:hypothetical protein n=1 Tax=unclassified Erwinia TaxID=2622719 RepID=UPI000C17AD9E|nr:MULTISPECIES: hypothetical protein [unclassified Erwinia]PIJ78819.1 hypothetical protein BLD47_16495 [Erwinia sp. OLCASP19]PIJ88664.1 hypothetical protein BL249_17700 [Erwinia sp. OLFS4]
MKIRISWIFSLLCQNDARPDKAGQISENQPDRIVQPGSIVGIVASACPANDAGAELKTGSVQKGRQAWKNQLPNQ